MENIIFYYFSGTGNTLKVVKLFKEEAEKRGANVDIVKIAPDGEPDVSGYTRIGIAYPIHGFNTPEIVTDFLKKLPCGDLPVFVLKNSGEPLKLNDSSSRELKRIVEKKGYSFQGERHYIMPYNMVFRHSDAMATKMWNVVKERLPKDTEAILAGEIRPLKYPARAVFMTALCKIERPGMKLNGRFYRVNSTKCIRCMKCVKNCPVNNIGYVGGKFKFGGDCIGCASCAFGCPTDAITTGLLNCIKVNGAYKFDANPDEAVIGKYCHKSYVRYFAEDKKDSNENK